MFLVGRLAVDARYRGQRLGQSLLFNALRRSLVHGAEIAAMAVIVDAISDDARSFYEHFGFRRFTDDEYRLCMEMGRIERLVREQG